MIDKVLHIAVSSYLTIGFKAIGINPIIPTLAIGAATECMDYERSENIDECIKDFGANVIGIALGLLIIKALKQ